MVPRGGLPQANENSGLDCQTKVTARLGTKRHFAPLSNRTGPPDPEKKSPAVVSPNNNGAGLLKVEGLEGTSKTNNSTVVPFPASRWLKLGDAADLLLAKLARRVVR
jgi:hypothetical protein